MWNINNTTEPIACADVLKRAGGDMRVPCGPESGRNRGVALLILIVVLAAVLSIAVSMTQVTLAELRIAREVEYSVRANFAGDQGLERTFYRDRVLNECSTPSNCEGTVNVNYPDGTQACYEISVTKIPNTSIRSRGFYRCDGTGHLKVQRTWEATY